MSLRHLLVALLCFVPARLWAQWAQVTINSPSNGMTFATANAQVLFDACSTVQPTSVQVVAHGVGFSASQVALGQACIDWPVRKRYSATVTLVSGANTVRAEVCHSTQSPGCVSHTITIYYEPGQPYAMALNRTANSVSVKDGQSGSYQFNLVNTGYLGGTAWIGGPQCVGGVFNACSQDPAAGTTVRLEPGQTQPVVVSYTASSPGAGQLYVGAYYLDDVNVGAGQMVDVTVNPRAYAMALNRTTGPVSIRQDHSGSYTFTLVNTGDFAGNAWVGSQCTNIFSACAQSPAFGSYVYLTPGQSAPITVTFTGSVVGSDYVWTNAYYAENVNVGAGNNQSVSVTPKIYSMTVNRTTGPVDLFVGGSASYTFTLANDGDFAGNAWVGSQCTNIFSSCAQSPAFGSYVYLAPGQSAPITVTFTGSVVGSDYVWTNAYYAENVNVGAGQNIPVTVRQPVFTLGATTRNPRTTTERGDCLTIQAAPGAAYECGDLRVVQALPTTITLNKPRTPTLLYSSRQARPTAWLAADVLYSGTVPGQLQATVQVAGATLTKSFPWNPACDNQSCRVVVPIDQNLATGVYPASIQLKAVSGSTTYGTSNAVTDTVVVVNRATSPFGSGWWLDGLEQLVHVTGDKKLWIGGDGSTRLYVRSTTYYRDAFAKMLRSYGGFAATPWDSIDAVSSAGYSRAQLRDTILKYGEFEATPWESIDAVMNTAAFPTNASVFVAWSGRVSSIRMAYDRPDTLLLPGNGTWRRQLGDGAYVEFDNAGRHVRTVNALGWVTRFVYKTGVNGTPLDSIVLPTPAGAPTRAYAFSYALNGNGDPALTSVTAPAASFARTVSTSRTNHFTISGLTDIDGYSTGFGYDGAGRMTTRINKLGDTTYFAYNDAGALVRMSLGMSRTEGAGAAQITSTFQPAETRSAASPTDGPTPMANVSTSFDGPRIDVSDVTTFFVNKWGAPDTVVNALGERTRVRRESSRFPALVTASVAANGFERRAYYGSRGLLDSTVAIDPFEVNCATQACNAVTRYHWHPLWNHVDTATGPTGERTITQYQSSLPLPSWIQTGNNTSRRTTFGYNASNQVSAVTEPGGSPSAIAYDALGNVSRTTSPSGIVSEVFRDAVGRDTLTLEPTDAAQTVALKKRTRTRYGSADRVDSTVVIGAAVSYTIRSSSTRDAAAITSDTLATDFLYDAEGRRTQTSVLAYPAFNDIWVQESWRYDAAGRTKSHGRNQVSDQSVYDAAGNLTAFVSAGGSTYTQAFDALNRLTQRAVAARTYARQFCEGFVAGPLTDPANGSGCLVVFPAYPNSGTSYVIPADTARFTYDALGNTLTADNRDARVHRQYYRGGALKRDSTLIVAAQGSAIARAIGIAPHYDLSGRRDALTLPNGTAFSYAYGADDGALSTIVDPTGVTYRYVYDIAGRVDSLVIGGGAIREKRWYDADSRQYARQRVSADASIGVISNENLSFDAQGRVTLAGYYSGANGHYQDSTYLTYSGLGAVLARERRDWGNRWEAEEFRVDALGNVIRSLSTGSDVSNAYPRVSSYGRRGALMSRDGVIPAIMQPYASDRLATAVDADGHTLNSQAQMRNASGAYTQDTPSRSYYSGDRMLRAVQRYSVVSGGSYSGVFEEYRYDALGRRVLVIERHADRPPACDLAGMSPCASMRDFGANVSKVTWTVWDGNQIVQEERTPYPDGGTTGSTAYGLVQYVHGPEIDKPLAALYPAGSPAVRVLNPNWRGLFESSVTLSGSGADCAFGGSCAKIAWPAGQAVYARPAAIDREAGSTPFTFAGTLLTDQQDGSGQLYRRNRYYDPQSGRFTQEDPIGLAGGMNLYGFAGGDPINISDPFGLCPPCSANLFQGMWQTAAGKISAATGAAAALASAEAAGFATAWTGQAPPAGGGAGWLLGKAAMGMGTPLPFSAVGAEVGVGTTVYRGFGGSSGQMGRFWTTENPLTTPNFAAKAGLPQGNTMTHVVEGVITDAQGIRVTRAAPGAQGPGGIREVQIPNAAQQVKVKSVKPYAP